MSKKSFWKNSKENRRGSYQVFKLDTNKALCCKYAPCARNCMKHLLYIEETGLCPGQVDQKLGQISLGTKFLEDLWEILEEILPLEEIPKEKLLELMSEILEKLQKTPVLPCTQVLIALQEEQFLESIYNSDFGDDKLIDNAKKKFKESKRKAGILLCVTDKMSHGLILKRDEEGEQVNLYDSTIDEDKMVDFGIIHSLQVLVLEDEKPLIDKKPLIAKLWSKLKMCYCLKDYLEAHANNVGKKPKESVSQLMFQS
ncbi:uncharacterized protein LOC124448389 [Xenia sp. Carnegie-2017]|uniref:uncharacterized protein LOC124448389 n=1 Tax=Xenia sp. Carnegie-2017 TaxID=2897299 RepID=UPI001F0392EF|nr:uncharacterized protein LOC124448389 [Xenia sp. Carnegie-2017]XP_046855364.1 uncharacterized protein LOC124448389 [Xenia sp. Carnegie-2017]XP_046855372.1 uncharacterized protein LOC124448389 [Xenia sp. Carnegie-2017]XP_046855378.1 uncharacterized protein LOC124448389 [Xenia sp. Carnegie-2017]XP_046855387.1 uncharacterized protein LOC124448389 [Xenia sp. Carnegie-2017]XP_046855394.1 uncharacterized protein LOC124448389 [Xenia sp. Carnegie-2017]